MIRFVIIAICLLSATTASALDLLLPNAVVTRSENEPAGSVRLPKVPWSGTPAAVTEGRIDRQSARIPQPGLTTLQLIEPLRSKLKADGYEEVFACADASCGGFDFRFQLDLLPAPDMYVDLGDYRYALLERTGSEPHTISIVASRSRTDGFIHVTEVSNASFPEPEATTARVEPDDTLDPEGFIPSLLENGHAVLSDLDFGTGSADLGVGDYASLQTLSLWLETNPTARVVLVGHTDAVGSLDANTSLSRRRALSVVNRLVADFGADAGQLEAAGAGYLSPIASNLTEDGRAVNRRVEVVLLSLN